MRDMLLSEAYRAAKDCSCERGCPSCTGPESMIGPNGKKTAMEILEAMLNMKG